MQSSINLLNQYSEIVSLAPDEAKLNELSAVLLEKLKKVTLKEVHPLVVNALCNNICAKILTEFGEREISRQANELVEYMNEQSILPPVYKTLFDQMQLRFYNSVYKLRELEERDEGGPRQDLPDNLNNNLNLLLNLDSKVERYLNKNFGYALLDLNGDFIWCDPNCEKFFELRAKELPFKNFFELMIPFSKNLLTRKFGEELFGANNYIGSSLAFSYVIYSRNSMNKFLKCLKKLNIRSEAEFHERMRKRDTEDAIYHQYLKALSSRATLVLLKFTRGEFRNIIASQKYNINITRSLNDVVQLPPPSSSKGGEAAPASGSPNPALAPRLNDSSSEEPPKRPCGRKRKQVLESEAQETLRRIGELGETAHDGGDVVLRNAILIETRLSLNVPQFDYRKLADDPRIKMYEEKIIKKICKRME